jgi:uroporphyrinogen-III decarboxylase
MGNADCRILQFGTREDIEREIKRCIDLGRNCPGYFMLTSNHIPNGIPLENVDFYFETFERMRKR